MRVSRNLKLRGITKAVLLILGISLILFTSELIFVYRNRPDILAKVYLNIAEVEAKIGNSERALKNLDRAASFHIKQNKTYYKDRIPLLAIRNQLTGLDEETRVEISKYLTERLPLASGEKSMLLTSNIYYNLGLITYSRGYFGTANNFFQTSIYLNPELSFLFVELANSYFNSGNFEKGVETLDYCLEFEFPKEHCREYLENNVKSQSYSSVGTFKELVPKYQGLAL